ncbi:hypothetical protein MAPG_03587 [Magnaporthiopsis poae ATCC 64411]|uniref:F-box domain-containing protein n=1 Tax=Magnaporthiopsis poae (strain ATCC 64411 / 73-15) TaxID=644358 RepID=A0A0C4DUE7_MAGP6|nr:hypothetical protein MAPG_03587 [Magnaporthiopsis poae ATCC 64411]
MAMISPTADGGQNLFERLSPELRIMIFSEAVRQKQPIRIAQNNPALDVLLACRLFRAEATEWYYRENTFVVEDAVAALIWSARIGPYARFIRSVQLEVDISPLSADAWAMLGVPPGGHDTQWKGVVTSLPAWFPRLEELRLVIVAHLLKQEVGPDTEPRVHRFADIARELIAYLNDDDNGCLVAVRKACPNFTALRIGSPFPRDWELDYVESLTLSGYYCGPDGIAWYELMDPEPQPSEIDEDEEEGDDDDDDQDDEEENDEDDDDDDDDA